MIAIVLPLLLAACRVGDASTCAAGEFCAAAASTDGVCPETGTCQKRPDAAPVTLALPWPAGDRMFCAKAGVRGPKDSHSTCNAATRFGLDLAAPMGEPPRLVLAPADGVAWPYGGCATSALTFGDGPKEVCNQGFGNIVRIQLEGGLYVQVAHLSSILVNAGQRVSRGQPVGFEGNTGAAGPKHIHLSVHRGDAQNEFIADSVPFQALEAKRGNIPYWNLPCDDWTAAAPTDRSALISTNKPLAGPAGFFFKPQLTPARVQSEGEVLYWDGVRLQDAHSWDSADDKLRAAENFSSPDWLRPWSQLRRAEIAWESKRTADARALLHAATKAPGWENDREFAPRVRALTAKLSGR